jgi:hypothetical protein
MPAKKLPGKEHRRYIRLDTVFPVEFRLVSPDTRAAFSGWLQGFTNNIGKGGLCLQVARLDAESARLLREKQAKLSLNIHIPLAANPVPAIAGVAWMNEMASAAGNYLVGLSYETIDSRSSGRMLRYAWAKKLFLPAMMLTVLVLAAGLGLNTLYNARLTQRNRSLVEQLVRIEEEARLAKEQMGRISQQREGLQGKISALEKRIAQTESSRAQKERVAGKQLEEFNILLEKLSQERRGLERQMNFLQQRENSLAAQSLLLEGEKTFLEKANFEKMYQWLSVHQNPRTGLIASFEGDKDTQGWAFTYDQALAALAFTRAGDYERAKKILDFFAYQAQKVKGYFVNAYYVDSLEPAEYVVHSGPNVWLGIALAQYIHKSQDKSLLPAAEEIARQAMALQREDPEGGLRGGPEVSWYATEHNLDAYAFFRMLYQLTQNPAYRDAGEKALNWLLKHTYDRGEVPVKRGRGDSTIATDTYAWSIAALGPQKLREVGMDPDKIIQFAEENCAAEAAFKRPQGEIKIKGFDFAAQRHLARGAVISSEWTAQMVLAFQIMADDYQRKNLTQRERFYAAKRDAYLAELSKMVISSPSPSGQGQGCLPYASADFVDTGHGWMTPRGSSTGSVSGTVYALFAYYKFNPLELEE